MYRPVFSSRHTSFTHSFSVSWMSMAYPGNILGACTELHSHNSLGNHVCSTRAYHMYAQNLIGCSIGQYFNKTIQITACTGTAAGFEWERSSFIFYTGRFQLLFGLANSINFWPGINNTRYQVIINMWFLTGNDLGNKRTFIFGFVGQHGPLNNIA